MVVAGFSPTALSTLRCLSGSPYAVWSVGPSENPGLVLASRIPRQVVKFRAAEFVPFLRELRGRFDHRPALLLTEDAQVVEIVRRFADVGDYYRILLPPPETVDALMDKAQFTALALKNGYPIPVTRSLTSVEDLARVGADFGYPFILKPYLLHSRRIAGPADLASYVATFQDVNASSLIVQKWVPGGDDQLFFCFLLFDGRHRVRASFLGRKLRQNPPLDGTTSFCVSWDDEALIEETIRIFQGLDYRGYASMEYKYDAAKKRYFIMEPTVGRFDLQIALTMAAGVNFPRLLVDELFAVPSGLRRQGKVPAYWMNEASDLHSLWKTGQVWRFPAAWFQADVRVLFSWLDPAPLFYKLLDVFRKTLRLPPYSR